MVASRRTAGVSHKQEPVVFSVEIIATRVSGFNLVAPETPEKIELCIRWVGISVCHPRNIVGFVKSRRSFPLWGDAQELAPAIREAGGSSGLVRRSALTSRERSADRQQRVPAVILPEPERFCDSERYHLTSAMLDVESGGERFTDLSDILTLPNSGSRVSSVDRLNQPAGHTALGSRAC